ncbi:hypothetical protein IFM89_025255 [Coptis chinensis]|uniref:Pentatricopeptide repeat-containing protein n=1 Tax=Coptis chinensis TaxID=261450 RepID=A0A835I3B4_9MAGN|nr:hypothetical protein IFM89_025255 [Coptis chinensis]
MNKLIAIFSGIQPKKPTLYSRISPLGSPSINLVPVLDKWVEEGNKVHVADLQIILKDLRKHRRFLSPLSICFTLQISEWMNTTQICTFSSSNHAVQLDLIGRVRGLESAESYFNSLSDKDKSEKTYGALLNCYVKERLTDKSLSHMQKMKEMGMVSTSLGYSDLMGLYINTGEYEKVPGLLNEMKENGVSPDNFSYRMCIYSYGKRSCIDEMEKVLEEMENQSHISMDWNTHTTMAHIYIKAGLTDKAFATSKKSEEKLTKKDGVGYNYLISLFASLGNKTEVARLWGLKKTACKKIMNMDYIAMLGSLVKLQELDDAEKLLKEWESSGNHYDFRVPNVLLIAYTKRGCTEKAEAMLEDLINNGKVPNPNSWGIMAAGYVEKDEMEKALGCMRKAFSVNKSDGGWKPNSTVISSLLHWLGDTCEVKDVEDFVRSLKDLIPINKDVYYALIKANVREGKDVDGILESMKANKIDLDEENGKVLSLKEEGAEYIAAT